MGAGWMVNVRPSRLKTENQPARTIEKLVVSASATGPVLFCLRARVSTQIGQQHTRQRRDKLRTWCFRRL